MSDYHGHMTLHDGSHVPLTREQAEALFRATEEADARRREAMPISMDAIQTLHDAITRLRDEGWREGIYCPKDGMNFAVIEFGSTGIFSAHYSGEWPRGFLMLGDGVTNPRGVLWKPLDKLTEAEAAKLAECAAAERAAMERQLAAFVQMDEAENE